MVLATLDSHNLLFGEAAQAVYELDDFSAHVWRSLNSGLSPEQIAGEMIEAGADRQAAHSAVAAAVQQLDAIGATTATSAVRPPSTSAERLTRITLALAGVAVQLNLSEPLLADVDGVFGYLRSHAPDSHVQLSASLVGEKVEIRAAGRPPSSCERSAFLPLLKALLIESVLQCASYEVALHAAALVGDGNALLLLGSPGAGKTTLATALVRRGFEIAADDVVLLDETGLVTGLPLPFTVKQGAWSMLSRDWPELASQPVHWRPDGIEVRYVQNQQFADWRPQRIRFVILLDRQAGVPASLQSVGAIAALEALIAEGDARDDRLSERGFIALVTALRDTRTFRLTYSDLSEAAEIVSSVYS